MESTQGGAQAEAAPREIAAAWRFLVTGNRNTDDWMAAVRRASRPPPRRRSAGTARTLLDNVQGFPNNRSVPFLEVISCNGEVFFDSAAAPRLG
jgi:hypothetical protein